MIRIIGLHNLVSVADIGIEHCSITNIDLAVTVDVGSRQLFSSQLSGSSCAAVDLRHIAHIEASVAVHISHLRRFFIEALVTQSVTGLIGAFMGSDQTAEVATVV